MNNSTSNSTSNSTTNSTPQSQQQSQQQSQSQHTQIQTQINKKLKKALSLTKKHFFPFSLIFSQDYTSAANLYNEIANSYISINNPLKSYKYYNKASTCYLLDNEKGLSMHCLIKAGEIIYKKNKILSAYTYIKGGDIGMEIGSYCISGGRYLEAGRIFLEIHKSIDTGGDIGYDIGYDIGCESEGYESDNNNNNNNDISSNNIYNPSTTDNTNNPPHTPSSITSTNHFLFKSLLAYEKGVMAYKLANMKNNLRGVLNELIIILLKLKKYKKAGNIFIKMICDERKYNNSFYMLCSVMCYKVSKSGVYCENEYVCNGSREGGSRERGSIIDNGKDYSKGKDYIKDRGSNQDNKDIYTDIYKDNNNIKNRNKKNTDNNNIYTDIYKDNADIYGDEEVDIGGCVLQLEEEELKVYESLGTESYEEVCDKYFRCRKVDEEILLLFEEVERINRPENDIL
ncbi:hypothetical protein CWI37_2219p0010 [Hamiltosporidium tvaerminnensis]|uniref:TPR-like protein n=1 Tax=Hamiltosporidium tvaerminnensis TaxID=1176355 RepID=A0A4Q9KSL6_9MICR|nr:hypothetical protein CWI37_2219p0010 [Hamiltosporidium tvaerminnensis]